MRRFGFCNYAVLMNSNVRSNVGKMLNKKRTVLHVKVLLPIGRFSCAVLHAKKAIRLKKKKAVQK